jgi:hypothetical protein
MVVRWHKISKMKPGEERQTEGSTLRYDQHWRVKQAINAIGCVLTAIVMVVFAVTKFTQGAWIVVVLIPLLVLGFFRTSAFTITTRASNARSVSRRGRSRCAAIRWRRLYWSTTFTRARSR